MITIKKLGELVPGELLYCGKTFYFVISITGKRGAMQLKLFSKKGIETLNGHETHMYSTA